MATNAAPVLAEVRTSSKFVLTALAENSEMNRRLKEWRKLVEDMRRTATQRKAGHKKNLLERDDNSAPLKYYQFVEITLTQLLNWSVGCFILDRITLLNGISSILVLGLLLMSCKKQVKMRIDRSGYKITS